MRKILVSACLCGEPVRYDGKSKPLTDRRFSKWQAEGRLILVCPETSGGLPTPRPDAQRTGERVLARTGADVTEAYEAGALEAVRLAREHDVAFALLKEKSPSCGSRRIYDGSFTGIIIPGQGLAAEHLRAAGFAVFSEEELDAAAELLAEVET